MWRYSILLSLCMGYDAEPYFWNRHSHKAFGVRQFQHGFQDNAENLFRTIDQWTSEPSYRSRALSAVLWYQMLNVVKVCITVWNDVQFTFSNVYKRQRCRRFRRLCGRTNEIFSISTLLHAIYRIISNVLFHFEPSFWVLFHLFNICKILRIQTNLKSFHQISMPSVKFWIEIAHALSTFIALSQNEIEYDLTKGNKKQKRKKQKQQR